MPIRAQTGPPGGRGPSREATACRRAGQPCSRNGRRAEGGPPAQWRVDLHSSNADFEELPQVRLYDPSEEERKVARWLGLPAVIERPVSPTVSATLGWAWKQRGGRSLVIQAGQAGSLQQEHCER